MTTLETRHVKRIPAEFFYSLSGYSREEFLIARQFLRTLYRKSIKIWTLRIDGEPAAVIGIVPQSLLGGGYEIWFFLCEGYKRDLRRLLRWLKRGTRRLSRKMNLQVNVSEQFPDGCKFVQACGFQFTNKSGTYLAFELRKSWRF